MLVLSRQRDESIKIGDDIEITVVDIRGEKVRLGINAPPHVPVHRKEVYEAIKREQEATAKASGNGTPAAHVGSLADRKQKPIVLPAQSQIVPQSEHGLEFGHVVDVPVSGASQTASADPTKPAEVPP